MRYSVEEQLGGISYISDEALEKTLRSVGRLSSLSYLMMSLVQVKYQGRQPLSDGHLADLDWQDETSEWTKALYTRCCGCCGVMMSRILICVAVPSRTLCGTGQKLVSSRDKLNDLVKSRSFGIILSSEAVVSGM
jgi:hypothetical protein